MTRTQIARLATACFVLAHIQSLLTGAIVPASPHVPTSIMVSYQGSLGTPHVSIGGNSNVNSWENLSLVEGRTSIFSVTATDVTTFTVSVAPPAGYDVYINGNLRNAILLEGSRDVNGTPVSGSVTIQVKITVVRNSTSGTTFIAAGGTVVEVEPLGAASAIQFGTPYYDNEFIDDLWANYPRLDFNLGVGLNGVPLPPLKLILFPRTHLQGDAPEVPDVPGITSQTVGSTIRITAPQVVAIFSLVGSGPSYTLGFAVPGQENAPFVTYTFTVTTPNGNVACTVKKQFAGATASTQTVATITQNLQEAISLSYDDWHETPPQGQAGSVQRRVVVSGASPASNFSTISVTDGGSPALQAAFTRIDYHQIVTPVFLEDGGVYSYKRWIPHLQTEGYGGTSSYPTTFFFGLNNEQVGTTSPAGTTVLTQTNALRLPHFTCRTWLDLSPIHNVTWNNGTITAATVDHNGSAKTEYSYVPDWNGIARLPSAVRTTVAETVNSVTTTRLLSESSTFYAFDAISATNPTLLANGQPFVIGTTYLFESVGNTSNVPRPSSDGSHLQTIAKRYREDSPSGLYSGMPYSMQLPDGTKTSYAYELGTFANGVFTPGSGSELRVTTLHGVANGTTGSTSFSSLPSGVVVDALGLVVDRSTKLQEIRKRGLLVQRERFVYTGPGAFERISWETFTYADDGRLETRNSSNNVSSTIAWQDQFKDRKDTVTDETGLVTTFGYDTMGRLTSISRAQVGGLPAQRTEYSYNGANRVTHERFGPSGSQIVTQTQYDIGGRITGHIAPGNITTNYTYSDGDRILSTTYFNSTSEESTRVDTRFHDGRIASVTGTAVVHEYHKHGWDANHRPTHTVRLADNSFTSTTGRIRVETRDLLGRVREESSHGFGSTGNANPTITRSEYNALGQKTRSSTVRKPSVGSELKLSADTLFVYDIMGQLEASGLDLDNDGTLDDAGTDRFSVSTTKFFKDTQGGLGTANALWLFTLSKTYYKESHSIQSPAYHINRSYVRVGDLPTGIQGHVVGQDFFNNSTITTTSFAAGSKTRVELVERPDGTRVARSTIGGLLVQSREYSDAVTLGTAATMTTTFAYDAQGRLTSVTDPRGLVSSQDYATGTRRVHKTYGRNPTNTGNITLTETDYDAAGRVLSVANLPKGSTVTTTYWPTGRLKLRSGSGTYPVRYEYDVYGQQTELWTYRQGSAGTPDKTTWVYDVNTGWLTSKVDAAAPRNANGVITNPAGRSVNYDYSFTSSYRVVSRTWARSPVVTTTYQYRLDNGDLENVLYSDNTPDIHYEYTRSGRIAKVDEIDPVTSTTRTLDFIYNNEVLASEVFDTAFYNQLVLTHRLQDTPSLDRSYNLVPGRSDGIMLGFTTQQLPTDNLDREYQVSHTYDDFGRLNGLNAFYKEWTSPGPARDELVLPFSYTYKANTSLWETVSQGNYTLSRAFEQGRNVLETITASRGATITQFAYRTNNAGERESVVQSGAAFNDLGPGTYFNYGYNSRGELTSAAGYRGTDPTIQSNLLPLTGRGYEFSYDTAGNRETVSMDLESINYQADVNGGGDLGANNLNQSRSRGTLQTIVSGTAEPTAAITVDGTPVSRSGQGSHWAHALSSYGRYASVPVVGTLSGSPNQSATIWQLTRPAIETFTYDADGNLTHDGLWNYTWDAENRLIGMTTSGVGTLWGAPAKALSFTYDYVGRRIRKVANVGGVITDRKYLYNGWDLMAELDGGTNNVVRSYVWGDGLLLQTVHGAGTLTAYHVARDGNSNVAALINASSGAIAAAYEYGPFGEQLRAQSFDPTVESNPFRFSSYFTDYETSLVYYGYRYYDPSLGRFLNRDPIGEAGGSNVYAFAGNDGVNRRDFLGLAATPADGKPPKNEDTVISIPYTPPWVAPPDYDSDSNTAPDIRFAILSEAIIAVRQRGQFRNEVNENNRGIEGPNSELRETTAAGGAVSLPTPTQDQINGVVAAWSRYGVRFQGSAADQQKLQTLFAQAVLFRRPDGSHSMAMREVVQVLVRTGGARITIGFGAGNETTRDHRGERSSFISIERHNSVGRAISAEQMVVSIMHEMLHATDRIRGMSYIERVERHNEIYRIQNQTLHDLGLPLDAGPGGRQIPGGDKYIGPGVVK